MDIYLAIMINKQVMQCRNGHRLIIIQSKTHIRQKALTTRGHYSIRTEFFGVPKVSQFIFIKSTQVTRIVWDYDGWLIMNKLYNYGAVISSCFPHKITAVLF